MAITINMHSQRNRFASYNYLTHRTRDNKVFFMCSGVALANFADSGGTMRRDRITLGLDIRFAIPRENTALIVRSHVPFVTINTIQDRASNTIVGVDAFDLTPVGRPLHHTAYLHADVACLNAPAVRIGFHLSAIADVSNEPELV